MRRSEARQYRSPADPMQALNLHVTKAVGEEVVTGELRTAAGVTFPIPRGIPDFTWPQTLLKDDAETRASYDKLAAEYDKFAPLPFQTLYSDEWAIRRQMIDALRLPADATVLEIGCGAGRGSALIADRMGGRGRLYLQELAPKLLDIAVTALKGAKTPVEFSIANGSYLPFPDNMFDAAHHFGGINTFSEIRRCLSELARVVKPGGRVVVGDESIGPWLHDTEFGRVMMNSNPLFRCQVPVAALPVNARDVTVQWVAMDAFFYIGFTVGEGPPQADYHIPIPSERGGSHWTRYYGNLEGVSDEAKRLAQAARQKRGQSMHAWLDAVVRTAAKRDLEQE
ncbi:MAG: methyltransferase domain-containing protein [Verrucomicrobia bacterium]|nr:methyltransferase domain-containing protein [Verrucomicrobiota bacterium]